MKIDLLIRSSGNPGLGNPVIRELGTRKILGLFYVPDFG